MKDILTTKIENAVSEICMTMLLSSVATASSKFSSKTAHLRKVEWTPELFQEWITEWTLQRVHNKKDDIRNTVRDLMTELRMTEIVRDEALDEERKSIEQMRRRAEEDLELIQAQRGELAKKSDDMLKTLAEMDPKTAAFIYVTDAIERILPMPEGNGHRDEMLRQQVIRSRGIVMSASLGMTSIGAKPDQPNATDD